MRAHRRTDGFTLIEMMIVVTIIAILAVIAIPRFSNLIQRSRDGALMGTLGAMRSAISIYYAANENQFPLDDLACLRVNRRYLDLDVLPDMQVTSAHGRTNGVVTETSPTDSGAFSYNNDPTDADWGRVVVGCTHKDARGFVWTTY